MKLVLCKTLWGVEGAEDVEQWGKLFGKIAKEGYTAIETTPFIPRKDPSAFREALIKHGLRCVFQIHTSGGYFDSSGEYVYLSSTKLDDHLNSLRDGIEEAKNSLGDVVALINLHSGHDSWNVEQAVTYLQQAAKFAEEFSVRIVHETHRQRLFYNPYVTRDILLHESIRGQIEINADLSHWVCVCEHVFDKDSIRDKDWWPQVVKLVAEHCSLIHCRVGHMEGPQVSDPRDPAYAKEVEAHLGWWTEIWKSQAARSFKECWCEPEHGPAPYLQALPYTRQPVADLWEVNNAVRDLVKARFKEQIYAS
mmetsp:Transcript_18385/g.22600  ORF Transcript_18385/g.22600 Transcript_18385/m.22600 type:complete len:308 (+) Transcript_18385:325-1248(+)|eukprot:CAMPEP_0204830636 /NCGR_PEP_ID=MMETSP1346-20131115/9033_1 /ASSEMBLY_ACC=CAM_ASM_000771 /TAXON_ID=215587 /ORGANISM="Aplanochytrium stocchinoi, Strain GSBS06" /LENGTH=307 /DNA_ID=CAMNT_0051961087 /DNA_START=221 /DNA_END=1144 /DNA_ORIENTATION=+